MDEKNWQNVKEIFLAVLEKDAESRPQFLAEICADNAVLREEIESLLASHEEVKEFIETPAFQVGEVFTEVANHPQKHLGNYKILKEIGAGGMGVVYLAAREDEEFRKRVAIKLVKRGLDTEDVLRRFRNERQILASLHHPHIASLLDGGTSDNGLPYFVMEYIEGLPLLQYCGEHRLSINERLELFKTICSAVQHAHQNLVIHRDLKPSNILITHDGDVKLLDFGVAKFLNPELMGDNLAETQTQFRVMTPEYASPEQVRGGHITTATDIYSLGAILYELLTGSRPYKLKDTSPEELMHLICNSEPAKPSVAVTQNNRQRTSENSPAIVSMRQLKGDLDNIILTALRKEPSRRYKSVEAFAGDIERYLKGLPVAARPNTFRYRTEKFVQRNKVGVLATALVTIAVLAGLVTTVWQSRVAARERDQAQQAQAKAEQINSFLQNILSAASPEEKGKDAKVIEVLNDSVQKIDTEFAAQPELKAQALLTIGQTYYQLDLMDEAEKTLRPALQLNSELYGDENKATDSCRIYLGATLLNRAKLGEAEQLLNQAIETERKISPTGSKELALGLFVLGELYVRNQAIEKALPLLQESVAMSDKILGANNADSAYTLISLGRAQMFSGDLTGAETTYRQSVEIYRQLPARYAVRLGMALSNLGLLLVTKKEYDKGIGFMREADTIFFQKQGESFSTFESKAYLGIAFFSKLDYAQTIIEGNKAIAMGRNLKLENTPDFITMLEDVGLALTRTGKAKEGESFLREAVKIKTGLLSKESSGVAVAKGALGECLTALKSYPEAELLLSESYESLKTSQGAESSRTIQAQNRLTKLYGVWKKPEK